MLESVFFIASAVKFLHGGYFVVVIACLIVFIMVIWYQGTQITFKYAKSLRLSDFKEQLNQLRQDNNYELYQTNIVYLTNRMKGDYIDHSILYSILDKHPKRAKVYWFVNVKVTYESYTTEYKVDILGTDFIVCVELFLGFRMPQTVPRYLRTIVRNLVDTGRLPKQNPEYTITSGCDVGDFKFIVLDECIVYAKQLHPWERFVMQTKTTIKHITTSPARWFGLQFAEVIIEVVPLVLSDVTSLPIKERT